MDRQFALPIDVISFSELRKNNFIYVDKTHKLQYLIETGKRYFLSRQYGFGKTLTLSTLTAMFSGEVELFEGLAAYEFVKQYAEHPYKVINFDFESLKVNNLQSFNISFKNMVTNVAQNFGIDLQDHISDMSIIDIFNYVYKHFGSFVILIDNYDKPIMDSINDTELLFNIYATLKSVYETINSYARSIKFLLITGVQRYNAYGVFSTISGITDISARQNYGDILGYTHEELKSNFTKYIDQRKLKITSKDLFVKLKAYNDKFCFDNITNVYRSDAVLQSLLCGDPQIYSSYIDVNNDSGVRYSCINPGDRDFLDAKNSIIYVDKSELLIHINERIGTIDKYVCISRPRRFGKTIALNMIAAYYDMTCDASKVFDGLKITKHQSFSVFANKQLKIIFHRLMI